MSDLLPCPFCGGEGRIFTGQHNFADAQVCCLDCGMSGPDFDNDPQIGAFSDDPSADAAKHWNTRHAVGEAQQRGAGVDK